MTVEIVCRVKVFPVAAPDNNRGSVELEPSIETTVVTILVLVEE